MAKIIFVSSKGGHFSELMQLEKLMKKHDSVIVSERSANSVGCDYFLKSGSRKNKLKYVFTFVVNFFQALIIIVKQKPDLIISTGAHSCFHFFVLARLFGIKSIYIESFARLEQFSLTYKLIKKLATVKLVQHENLVKLDGSAKFIGRVF